MPTSNGKITKPVEVWDVKKCLGVTANSPGQLCSDPNKKVNPLARFKPVRYPKMGIITDEERIAANAMRIPDWTEAGDPDISSPPYKFGSVAQMLQYVGEYLEWYTDSRPRGGASEPCRLADFNGYNHKAIWYSFFEVAMENGDFQKYWTLGMKGSGQTASVPLRTLVLAIVNGDNDAMLKFKGSFERLDSGLKVSENYKDSAVWWRQKDIIDNYLPVVIIWKVNYPAEYHCVKGKFITSPDIYPYVNITKNDMAALLNKGNRNYLDEYYPPTDDYNTVKFMLVLFPKSMAPSSNGQIQAGSYFVIPPMFKSETNKFNGINVNKALAMWGGKIEARFLRQFYIQKMYCGNNWLTRHSDNDMGGDRYEAFGYDSFTPDTMVSYEKPVTGGSASAQFRMFTGYNQSYDNVQNAINNYTFMYDRLVFDVVVSNITEERVVYWKFQVKYGNKTEYLAGVIDYDHELPNGSTGRKLCQEPVDGNNAETWIGWETVPFAPLQRKRLTLDLGFILNSNYTLKGHNTSYPDFTTPALGTSNIRNPWVTNPRIGLLRPTIEITAENYETGDRVTLARFNLNLYFPGVNYP